MSGHPPLSSTGPQPVEHVQTRREIEAMLDSRGLRPRKQFGQHFLVDGNLMRRLAASAEIGPKDVVLEVGPGTGGLTDLLSRRAARVLAVEIDRGACGLLRQRFPADSNVELIEGDVLEGKHELNPSVVRQLNALADVAGGSVMLVANLPYQITSPLLLNLLLQHPRVTRMCFTVQAEVGDRITAAPGGKTFGPLAILVQLLSRVEVLASLPPHVFWPRPAVDSVMLRLDRKQDGIPGPVALRSFASLVRRAFDHRRKTLRSALGYVIDDGARQRVCDKIDASRRPESFSIEEWLAIFHVAMGGITSDADKN